MKPARDILLGSGLLGCAVVLGAWVWLRNPPEPETQAAAAESRHFHERSRASSRAAAAPQRSDATAATLPATSFRISGRPQVSESPLPEAEWFARAERVEREARRELERLTPLLGLDAVQQARVFSSLARQSDAWLPGMRTLPGGADAGEIANPLSPGDPLFDQLDLDQQAAFLREEMDRQAWWEEILPQLLPPEFPEPSDPTPSGPAVKDFEGLDSLPD
jgi:hypothetical protein